MSSSIVRDKDDPKPENSQIVNPDENITSPLVHKTNEINNKIIHKQTDTLHKKKFLSIQSLINSDDASQWTIAILTLFLVLLSAVSIIFTCRQISIYNNMTKSDLRAYISVKQITHNLSVGEKPKATVHFINIGKTPAYQLNHAMGIKIGGTGIYQAEIDTLERHIEFNNTAIGHSIDFSQTIESESILTDLLLQEILDGKKEFYVFGKFKYIDKFGDPHFTRYCHFFKSQAKTFYIYEKYNDSD